jgi:ketosteroid isomerase-like protein
VTTEVLSPLETVKKYYRLIDDGDLDGALQLFTEDADIRFADSPPIHGRENIADVSRTMLPMAKAISHEIVGAYEAPGPQDTTIVICEAIVTYTMRRSGNVIPHNAVTISEVDGEGRIVSQRNVGDLGPVLTDHAAHE